MVILQLLLDILNDICHWCQSQISRLTRIWPLTLPYLLVRQSFNKILYWKYNGACVISYDGSFWSLARIYTELWPFCYLLPITVSSFLKKVINHGTFISGHFFHIGTTSGFYNRAKSKIDKISVKMSYVVAFTPSGSLNSKFRPLLGSWPLLYRVILHCLLRISIRIITDVHGWLRISLRI